MPIDFFITPCNNHLKNCSAEPIHCLQNIPNTIFGISDIDGGNNSAAKVNTVNPDSSTNFIVNNNSKAQIAFKAVDWCVDIYRTGTYSVTDENRDITNFSSDNINTSGKGLIKRCEGFLQFNNTILFIEIKNRPKGNKGWLKDAREKFEETILSFREHHPAMATQIIKPILSNPSFPGPHQNETIQKKILKDKIGLEFIRQDEIIV